MTTDISLPCCRCGRPASLGPHGEGEHHEPRRGMGGAAEEPPQVPLCREHHSALHAKKFSLLINGDFVSTTQGGIVQSERALLVKEDADDTRYWSDEHLAGEWTKAEAEALVALADQCRAAYEFWRRYGWRDKWYIHVAEYLSVQLERPVHWRRVYERANLWPVFRDRWADYHWLGARVAIAVAEDAEPEDALSIATVAMDMGHSSADTVEMIRKRERAKAAEPPETCKCPRCGALHRMRTTG